MAPAKRHLADIVEQLRTAIDNDTVSMTLIQTQDLQTLVDAAAKTLPPMVFEAVVLDEIGRIELQLRGEANSDYTRLVDGTHSTELTRDGLSQLHNIIGQALTFYAEHDTE